MKKYLLLTLIFIPFITFAQGKKFSYGISIYSNLSSATYSKNDTGSQAYVDIYKEDETFKTSYSIHAYGEYAISSKSHLTIGLGFQNSGYSNKTKTVRFIVDPTMGGGAEGDKIKIKYITHNIELPIHFKSYINSKTFATLGVIGQYRLGTYASSKTWHQNGRKQKTRSEDKSIGYRDMNLAIGAGVGKDLIIKDHFSLFVQGYGQYGLLGLKKDVAINRNLLSIGITTGIRFL